MIKYIIKRILIIIPMMLFVSIILFLLINVSSKNANPGRVRLGFDATEEQVVAYNESIGLYDPLPIRYIDWLKNVLQGDLGESWYYEKPVWTDIAERLPYTVTLTIASILIAMIVGIPLGILSAVKQYSAVDRISTVLAMLIASIPIFCMATILMLVFSYKLRWVPASGVSNGIKSWILPCLTLGNYYAARFLRFTRSTMLETIRKDYVRTARAKGAPELSVIMKHSFRNTLLPLITITGTYTGVLLGGAVVVENVFVIPGLGTMVVDALGRNDMPVIMGTICVLALIFLLIMLVVDVLYAIVDPQIRGRYSAAKKTKKKTETAAEGT